MSFDDVRNYYGQYDDREWSRLERSLDGVVEFAVTCRMLESYLPPKARVLDIGGGPGRYTIWLAAHGYRPLLADLSPNLLDIARAKIAEANLTEAVEAIVEANATDLSHWEDGSFDAVLCLGPFYHLTHLEDRNRAASELRRVLRPGGSAFVAMLPYMGYLRRTLAVPDERHHLLDREFVGRIVDDGVFLNDVPGRFGAGFGFRPQEVVPFFAQHGLETERLMTAEGFASGLNLSLDDLAPEEFEAVVQLVIETADDPSALGMTGHLLLVARAI